MSPGGHLITTAIAGGVVLAATGSMPLVAGITVGGFLIDLDHVLDYVMVERRRELTPGAFLRYYSSGRAQRVVLALHSYELLLVLAGLAWWFDSVGLAGYLAGAAMHLALDLIFNGRLTPRNIFAFYSFGFRLVHRFDADALFGSEPRRVPAGFWRLFFVGPRLAHPPRRAAGGRPARQRLRSRLLDASPSAARRSRRHPAGRPRTGSSTVAGRASATRCSM